jgi:hypothetical protein
MDFEKFSDRLKGFVQSAQTLATAKAIRRSRLSTC